MARGFKPVGWVAGVAAAALGCYMLSLNVASERAELARIERGIVMAKQDIRTLQTELGTRGRLQQLEHWNAEVLALSAPTSAQFLDSELTLARFDRREQTMEERATVRMASAPAPKAAPVQQAIEAPVRYAAAPAAKPAAPLVHRASLVVEEEKLAAAPAKKPAKVAEAALEKKKKKKKKKVEAKPAAKPPVKSAEAKKPEKKPEPKKTADAAKSSPAKLVKKAETKSAKAGSAGGQ